MGICVPPLTAIAGTGFNVVQVPGAPNSAYKSIAEELLYEIWQVLLLILTALGGAPMTTKISFSVDDGQAGSPVNGDTSLQQASMQGISIFNKLLLVIREGIELKYSSPVEVMDIRRFNSAGNGGFVFEPPSGLSFQSGERYNIFIIGTNTTVDV